jgi:outer membrane immunogenic protein
VAGGAELPLARTKGSDRAIPFLSVMAEIQTPERILATLPCCTTSAGGFVNRFLVAAVVIAGSTASASAADLGARPYTKVPAVYAGYDWSGFYIGGNVGEALTRSCWSNTVFLGFATVPSFAEGCSNAAGATLGGQVGYRWQSISWVFGLEAQGNWADLSASNQSLLSGAITNASKVDAIGLLTGQLGYSGAWENCLIYVKGGAAVANDKYNGVATITNTVFDTARETRWGAVAGIGGEYGFAPNWSFGIEWDHLFMGNRNVGFTSTSTPTFAFRTESIRQDIDMVTARINYHWGASPVVARY